MWISEPMPVTTRIIMPDSGSSRNPHVTSKLPMPSCVASGIFGIHSSTLMSNARASAGRPSSCQNATSDSPSAASIIVVAKAPAVLRENERMPNRPLTAAPNAGSRGISQMYCMSEAHQVHFVDVDGLYVAVEGQDDAETDGRFGRGDGDDENREHLADGVALLLRIGNQVDVDRVENQLDRHEDDDDVPADHDADDADDEQRGG